MGPTAPGYITLSLSLSLSPSLSLSLSLFLSASFCPPFFKSLCLSVSLFSLSLSRVGGLLAAHAALDVVVVVVVVVDAAVTVGE